MSLGRTNPQPATALKRQISRTIAALEYEQSRMQEEMQTAKFPPAWIKWTIQASQASPAKVEKEVLSAMTTNKGRAALKRCINNIFRLATKAESLSKQIKVSLNGHKTNR